MRCCSYGGVGMNKENTQRGSRDIERGENGDGF